MPHKHVVDTHALVWYLEADPRLGAKAKTVLDDPTSELVLPLIALAEAVFIVEKGRTTVPLVADLIRMVQSDVRLQLDPVDWEVFQHHLGLTALSEMHDRFIVAAALRLRTHGHTTSVLTKDKEITQSGLVTVVW